MESNSFLAIAPNYLNRKFALLHDSYTASKGIYSANGDTAEIIIDGALGLSYGVSYAEITNAINEAAKDDMITRVKFLMNSGGGACAGMMEVAKQVEALSSIKKTEAFIFSACCSAAYTIIAGVGKITSQVHADVGSIGAVQYFDDYSGLNEKEKIKTYVVASGEEKGLPYFGAKIPEEVLARAKGQIDSIADEMYDFIRSKRPGTRGQDVFQGACFLGSEAMNLGLVDDIGDYEYFNSNLNGVLEMDKEKAASEDIEAIKKASFDEGVKHATESFSELSVEFPDNTSFVVEQFIKGSNVAEAKVAFCDVLKAENAELKAVKVSEVVPTPEDAPIPAKVAEVAPVVEEAEPIPHGEAAAGTSKLGMVEAARVYMAENKTTLTVAMKALAVSNPELVVGRA